MSHSTLAVRASGISREFKGHQALQEVSLSVSAGEIHALLGPNAAGKSTLLRILAGLTDASSGTVRVLESLPHLPEVRRRIGWVPSTDRSFYLRISGLENLVFFARLNGMRSGEAKEKARALFGLVGLGDAEDRRVGLYSHGMLKRLAIARAMISDPDLLLIDEATHDLDPRGGRDIRSLVQERVEIGAAVVWATQRLEEVVGFAQQVTVLDRGVVRFQGSVEDLISRGSSRRFRMRLRGPTGPTELSTAKSALLDIGSVESTPDNGYFLVDLSSQVSLGQGIERLIRSGIEVVTCNEERSEVESAFLALTGDLEGE